MPLLWLKLGSQQFIVNEKKIIIKDQEEEERKYHVITFIMFFI